MTSDDREIIFLKVASLGGFAIVLLLFAVGLSGCVELAEYTLWRNGICRHEKVGC